MLHLSSALRGGPLAAAVLAVMLAAGSSAPAASAGARELRIGTAPPLPAHATLAGTSSSIAPIQLTIALAPRNPAALAAYARAVSTPSAAGYRHFLSTSQFRARFAPTPAVVRAVNASLRAHGLAPGRLDASGLALHVRASAGLIEHAFALTLERVRLEHGRDAIYNLQAPALDARIAPHVQAVIGLSTLYPARSGLGRAAPSHAGRLRASARAGGSISADTRAATADSKAVRPRVTTGGPQACPRAVNEAPGYGGYTANQIASYYDFSPLYRAGDKGRGVTVALFELEPDSPADVAVFQRCYGTHTHVSYVKVDGGAGVGSGSGEATLDIDQMIGLVPKARLLVYQGPNTTSGAGPYDVYAAIANQDRASVISSSWGTCEPQVSRSTVQAEQTVFEQMAVQGQTMVVAGGDSGAEDCFIARASADNSLEVDDPASQPFVTSVGGTSLELGDFNIGGAENPLYPTPNPPETVWNNSYPGLQYQSTWGIMPGAGGGGISKLWPMPAYQASALHAAPWLDGGLAESSNAPCGAPAGSWCRELPDVSANADPMDGYMSYWNGRGVDGRALSGWQSVGGTSAAAPVWAAVFALADASRACAGNLVGFVNPALYALASSSASVYHSDFNDITADAISAAGNDNDLAPSGNTSSLYQAAAGYDMATGLGTPHAANIVSGLCAHTPQLHATGARRSFVGAREHLQLRMALPAGSSGKVSYSAKGLPPGLHLNPSSGLIAGRIRAAGRYETVLGGHTADGDYGTRKYLWDVTGRPVVSALSLHELANGELLLAFTVSSGQLEPPLRSVSVKLPPGISARRPLRGIAATGAAGRTVPHRLSLQRGGLTLTFARSHTPLRIAFAAQTLGLRRVLPLSRPRPLRLVLKVVDAAGHTTTLMRRLTPARTP